MRGAHGGKPAGAVGGRRPGWYRGSMKTAPHAPTTAPQSEVRAGRSRARRLLRAAALVVVLAAVAGWTLGGARVGWTQTSVTHLQTDEITGIEYPVRQPAFVPGLEIPVAGALLAAGLAGLSLFSRGTRRAA